MSISTIVIIVGWVLLGIILTISFFIGYKRRFVRGAVNFGISVVLVIVAYLLTPVIAKAILGIGVSVDGTTKPLSQLLIDMISGTETIKTAIETTPALEVFLESVPLLVVNILVFIILYAIMRLLGYIVYKIIDVTCLKKREQKPTYNAKRDKWLGGGFGIFKGLVFVVLAFAPLTALTGMFTDLRDNTQALYTASESGTAATLSEVQGGGSSLKNTKEIIEEVIPAGFTDAIEGYNKCGLGIISNMFGLDNVIFDELAKFNVDDESIMLRKDALNYAVVYNTATEMLKAIDSPEGKSFKDVDWATLNKYMDKIFESGLIKGLGTNIVGDFIKNYDKYTNLELTDYKGILDALAASFDDESVKEYFLNDIKQAYNVFAIAGEEGILDTIILDKTSETKVKINLTLSGTNKEAILKMVNCVLDMNILKDAISPILKLATDKIQTTEIDIKDSSTEVSDWGKFKSNILNIVGSIIDVNSQIAITDIVDDVLIVLDTPEEKVDKTFDYVGKMLDNINELEVFKKDNKSFLQRFLENNGLGNLLVVQGEPEINNYSKLFNYLKTPAKNMLKIDLYGLLKDENSESKDFMMQIAKVLSEDTKVVDGNKQYSDLLTEIITKLYKDDAIRDNFFTEVVDMISGVKFINLDTLNVYTGEGENRKLDYNTSYNNWEYDIKKISQLIIEAYDNKIGEGEAERSVLDALVVKNEDFKNIILQMQLDSLDNILEPVLYSKSMKKLVNDALTLISTNVNKVTGATTTLSVDGKTFVEGAKEDQTKEIVKVIKAFIGIIPKDGSVIVFPDPDNDMVVANVTYSQIGVIMDTIKLNAYRVELTAAEEIKKSEVGVFNQLFNDLFAYIKTEYPESIALIGTKNPWEIKYTELLTTVEQIQEAKENVKFFKDLDTVVVDGNVDKDKVKDLLDTAFDYSSITDPAEAEAKKAADEEKITEIVNNATESGIEMQIPEENKEEITITIDSISDDKISPELKDKLKEFLGLKTADSGVTGSGETGLGE